MSYNPELNWKKSLFTSLDVYILTLTAVDIEVRSMKLMGEVLELPEGETEILVYFKYREAGTSEWTSTTKQSMDSENYGLFEQDITGLKPDTEYEYYTILENTSEEILFEGEILSSTTKVSAIANIENADNINARSVDFKGNITEINVPEVDYLFQYKEVGTGNWTDTTTQSTSSTGIVSFNQTGLSPDTDYEFRLKIIDDDVEIVTEIETFSTLPIAVINIEDATNISVYTATLNNEITTLNVPTVDVWFKYKKTSDVEWLETSKQSISSTGSVSASISNLTFNSEYEFKLMLEEGGDELETSTNTFTTLNLVEYDNIEATNIEGMSGDLNINITQLNVNNVDISFEYRKIGESLTSTTPINISSPQNVIQSIWLILQSNYEFRVKISDGTSEYYTSFYTFTTGEISGEKRIIITPGGELITKPIALGIEYNYFTLQLGDVFGECEIYISGDGKKHWQLVENLNIRTPFMNKDKTGVFIKIISSIGCIIKNYKDSNDRIVRGAVECKLE